MFTMRAKRRMKSRQGSLLIGLLVLVAFSLFYIYTPRLDPPKAPTIPKEKPKWETSSAEGPAQISVGPAKQAEHYTTHPILQLVKDAEENHQRLLEKQSKTLDEAVAEYRRRYGIPPPPNFDKWYKFARAKGVAMIDEYDSIHETLTPFWGLKPRTIRRTGNP